MVPISDLKAGNESAWKAFYADCYPKVKAMLLHKGCLLNQIDDFFQESMAIFYNRIVFGNPNNPDEVILSRCAFVKRIALNHYLKYLRDKKSTVELSETINESMVDEYETDSNNISDAVYSNKLLFDKCWKRLEEKCKKILTLYYFKKLRDKETAKKLAFKNAATVKSTRSKCMRQLRTWIAEINKD